MSDDKYIPGEKLSYVTEKNNFHLALAEVAYPVMQELTAREILPMNLVVRQDRRFFILQQTRTNRYVDFVAPVGSALPLHASAGGKILLCELPEVLRAQFLDGISFESMTPNTICTKRSFLEELDDTSLEAWLKTTLKSSVAFMALSRAGYEPRQYFDREDFSHLFDFNTVEVISVQIGRASCRERV